MIATDAERDTDTDALDSLRRIFRVPREPEDLSKVMTLGVQVMLGVAALQLCLIAFGAVTHWQTLDALLYVASAWFVYTKQSRIAAFIPLTDHVATIALDPALIARTWRNSPRSAASSEGRPWPTRSPSRSGPPAFD
jgi:hypothetical protein